jgi:hypothetical protein
VPLGRDAGLGNQTSGKDASYGTDGIVSVVAFAGSLKSVALGLLEYFVILKVDPPVPPTYARRP